jgi:hypothetical protein
MSPDSHRFRVAALLAAGALGVHQLRYLIGYGHESPVALAGQGHEYLSIAAPAVGVLVCLASAAFAVRLAGTRRLAAPAHEHRRAWSLWAFSSSSLLVIYGFQEWLEGQLEPGHPAGIAGIFAHGGWIAILLAIAIGGLVALVARGASVAIERTARRRLYSVPRTLELRAPPLPLPRVAVDPVAGHLGGRGPPISC